MKAKKSKLIITTVIAVIAIVACAVLINPDARASVAKIFNPSASQETQVDDLSFNSETIVNFISNSPYITCIDSTYMEMVRLFGDLQPDSSKNTWLEGTLFVHTNYPGKVTYGEEKSLDVLKEDDKCLGVEMLLSDAVPELLGRTIEVDNAVFGEMIEDKNGNYYLIQWEGYDIKIECDSRGNISGDSKTSAKTQNL